MKLLQEAPPLPETYAEALRYLTAKPFLASARHRAQAWRADRKDADPDILAFERAFIARFRKLGIPMFAHCVCRPEAVQARLFIQGRTQARPGQSPHNFGMAVDLVHGVRAWDVPRPCWDLIGHVGKEVADRLSLNLTWGGDWKFYDPAHWELADWEARVSSREA